MSAVSDTDCANALAVRDPPPEMMIIPDMPEPDRRLLVANHLAEFRKKLTVPQMDALMAKNDGNKPLYLKVAAEELRLQAQYGMGGSGVDVFIGKVPQETESKLHYAVLLLQSWRC